VAVQVDQEMPTLDHQVALEVVVAEELAHLVFLIQVAKEHLVKVMLAD